MTQLKNVCFFKEIVVFDALFKVLRTNLLSIHTLNVLLFAEACKTFLMP